MGAFTISLYVIAVILLTILIILRVCRPRSKSTAEGVAACRYLATFEDDPYVRCNDHLAVHFAPPMAKWLTFAPARYLIKFLLGRQAPGTYEQVVARTRLWDMAVLQLLKRNHSEGVKDARVQQLVILGAGYDTRAYRFDELLLENKVRVFEVDREAMQTQKMDILARVLRGKVPKYVTYVATDFKTGSLSKSLLDAGFDPKKITVWLWEGVTGYLTPEAVDSTVEFIRANSPRLSMLLFDFIRQSAVDDPKRHYGAAETAANVAKIGEPRGGFAIDEKKLVDWLTNRGFSLVQHITPRQLQQFARKSTGAYLGRVTGYLDHCVAQVEGTADAARAAMQVVAAGARRSPQQVVAVSDDNNNRTKATATTAASQGNSNNGKKTAVSSGAATATPSSSSTSVSESPSTPTPPTSSSSAAPAASEPKRAAKKKGKK